MRILGIDTAIRCTGYGVVDISESREVEVIDCGVIKNAAGAPHSECLRRLAGGVRELVSMFSPENAVIESAFYHKNVKTAMILSYARGAVMTALAEAAIPIYAYAPRKAKKSVTGNGGASKEQVAAVISATTSLDINQINLDSTDALAIAICHGQRALSPGAEHILGKPL